MTLTMTCDRCGQAHTVKAEAMLPQGFDSASEVQPELEVKVTPVPYSLLNWRPLFINGRHGHECSDCSSDRARNLNRKLDAISAKHAKALEVERAEAIAAWEATRRPTPTEAVAE